MIFTTIHKSTRKALENKLIAKILNVDLLVLFTGKTFHIIKSCREYKIVSDYWYQKLYKIFCEDSNCEMKLIFTKEPKKEGVFNLR